ncbi:MAG: TonB-dependent receptor [Bacteroidota bacterium]
MGKRLLFILIFFLLIVAYSQAQEDNLFISGHIRDENNSPLLGATIRIVGSSTGAVTDVNGYYRIEFNMPDTYTLEVSSIGYVKQTITVQISKVRQKTLDFKLKSSTTELKEVEVNSESGKPVLESGGLVVEAIELTKISSEASDVATILNRTAGINIRQSGGVGSTTRLNINGLQGKAIAYFRDGIPLDYMGNAFDLSILTANSLERVDIYKGVLPIELGADALGGAVNFVSRKERESNIDLSYEIASFSTHRATINAFGINNKGLYVNFLGIFNYSDNDYPVNVQVTDSETRNLVDVTTNKFHDTFRSLFGELQLGIRNKSWADDFKISIGLNNQRKDLQHGPLMLQAFGEAKLFDEGQFGMMNYEKKLYGGKTKIRVFGAYGRNTNTLVDTTVNVYNWFGEIERVWQTQGGETSRGNRKSLREFIDTDWSGILTVKHRISNKYFLTFNNAYTFQKRLGEDPIGLRTTSGEDPLTTPQSIVKNIMGLEWKSVLADSKLTYTVGIKHFLFNNSGTDYGTIVVPTSDIITNSGSSFGANASLKYPHHRP